MKESKFSPTRILIIGPAWIGDMIMAQTLFIVLKKHYPQALVDVVAPQWTAALLERMPEVNEAIALPINHGEVKLKVHMATAKQLRSKNYDAAYILRNSFKSALIPWLAKIPYRVGWCRELRSILLTDKRILNKQRYPLMIERFMALAFPKSEILSQPYPKPYFAISEKQKNEVCQHFQLSREKPILALCPGAEFGPAKRWPENYYAEAANFWLAKGGQVWLFGSAKDHSVCQAIQTATGNQCVDLAGKTNLGQAIDLLSCATTAVSNDSGLMHVLSALDKPLVAVYGSSSPNFTPPLTDNATILKLDLPCSPCFKRVCPLKHFDCMNKLKPNKVVEILEPFLE